MKISSSLRYVLALLMFLAASTMHADLKEEEQLMPELGIYVDINEDEWGAAKVNLRIYDNNFQMFFLDENDLLVTPPIESVIIHYGNFIKDANMKNTIVLERKDMMLTSGRVITPPHRYNVRIFLRKMFQPVEYYKEPYEEKEFIGLHTLNQLGEQFTEANKTAAYSQPLPEAEAADAEAAEPAETAAADTAEAK